MAIHRDTQWPCPDGFHIPTKDEWVALMWILTNTFSMASTGDTPKTYLKMPFAGYRSNSSSSVNTQGTYGYYWSSTAYSADSAYRLYFYSSSLNPQHGNYRAYGFSVRCFKDSPTIPDASWTTLYDWSSIATGAGIFHNATLWLISISGDWVNWTTIADKNVWATQVYNSWDTLSESNSGWYFQWWNNYMFPFTWTVTTSSTQVDASTYWPWNYYSSSTFITRSASPYNWSSVQNDNLWWWVTNWTWEDPPVLENHWHIGTWHMESYEDYSAMRWPCPEGFHIPSKNERDTLTTYWTQIWARTSGQSWAANSLCTLLMMTDNRYINWTGWYIDILAVRARYTCSWYSTGGYVWHFTPNYNNDSIGCTSSMAIHWHLIRPFKDEPVEPDGNWTVLYQGNWNAWIYHNTSLWLISISWDGNNRITIADSDLDWFFQRWNINPFKENQYTTSSTQVDASGYWPWNYYSSNIFITWSSQTHTNWSSIDNRDLRWWVTWVKGGYKRV